MTANHTQGRLHVCSHSAERLRDETGAWVADTANVRRGVLEGTANARRLAACWNACEGIATEDIEAVMVNTGPLLANKLAECDLLRAELDEARALLAVKFQAPPGPIESVEYLARQLVKISRLMGTVLTIEQRPRLPLAMGNYDTVVSVRPARVMAATGEGDANAA